MSYESHSIRKQIIGVLMNAIVIPFGKRIKHALREYNNAVPFCSHMLLGPEREYDTIVLPEYCIIFPRDATLAN